MSKSVRPERIRWGVGEALTPGLLSEGQFSVSPGQDVPEDSAFPLSVILQGAGAELQGAPPAAQAYAGREREAAGGASLYATYAGTLRVPVEVTFEGGQQEVFFKTDLRFFVRKDAETRALVVALLGGETSVWEFPYGQAVEGEDVFRSVRHGAAAAPVADYTATLLVRVERRDESATVVVQLDSLEVEINPEEGAAPAG